MQDMEGWNVRFGTYSELQLRHVVVAIVANAEPQFFFGINQHSHTSLQFFK